MEFRTSLDGHFYSKLMHALIIFIAATGIFAPLLFGLLFKIGHIDNIQPSTAYEFFTIPISVLLGATPAALALFTIWKRVKLSNKSILVLILASIFLKLCYSSHIDAPLTSDFKTMWEFASIDFQSGVKANSIQTFRSLIYFAPIAHFFNESRLSLELANIATTTATSYIFYLIGKRILDEIAARAVLVITLFASEPIFAIEAATHDIPGTFFLGIATLALLESIYLRKTEQKFFLLLIFCSAFAALEIQRNLGIFFIVSSLIFFLARAASGIRNDNSSIKTIALFLIFGVATAGLIKAQLIASYADESSFYDHSKFNTFSWIITYTHPESYGDYTEYKKRQPEFRSIPIEQLPQYALAQIKDNYANDPWKVFSLYKRKAERLYNLGRQGGDYFGPTYLDKIFHAYNFGASFMLLGISIISFRLLLFSSNLSFNVIFLISILGLVSLTLILIGEIQSRYIFAAWYILPIISFYRPHVENYSRRHILATNLSLALSSATILFALFVIFLNFI